VGKREHENRKKKINAMEERVTEKRQKNKQTKLKEDRICTFRAINYIR
jgi:hypothetical protein